MKSHTLLIVLCLGAFFIFGGAPASGQKNKTSPWNPSLDSASDKWKLTTRQKMFGDISKLEFGPFSIASIEKLDSPVIKKKIKGGANFGLELGYETNLLGVHHYNLAPHQALAVRLEPLVCCYGVVRRRAQHFAL